MYVVSDEEGKTIYANESNAANTYVMRGGDLRNAKLQQSVKCEGRALTLHVYLLNPTLVARSTLLRCFCCYCCWRTCIVHDSSSLICTACCNASQQRE